MTTVDIRERANVGTGSRSRTCTTSMGHWGLSPARLPKFRHPGVGVLRSATRAWYGAWESNPARPACKAGALPESEPREVGWSRRVESNHRRRPYERRVDPDRQRAMASPEGIEPSSLASETSTLPLSYEDIGTRGRNRTSSLPVRSRVLFRLSYAGMSGTPGRIRTATSRLRRPTSFRWTTGAWSGGRGSNPRSPVLQTGP